MSAATITSKGQITIPKEVRAALNLRSGDKINFLISDDGKVSFIPITKNITALKGIVAKPTKPVSIEDMKATIKRRGANG